MSVTILLALGALALPAGASANLPKKPTCSAVTAKLLKTRFGSSFSRQPSVKEHRTKAVDHLSCTYNSLDGNLSIDYFRFSSSTAARAHFSAVKKSLILEAASGISDGVTQLLPLLKVRGLGDMALRSTDGTVIEFVDGIDGVTISNGFADIGPKEIRAMVAFAEYVEQHA